MGYGSIDDYSNEKRRRGRDGVKERNDKEDELL